jgi:hypothetical protein
VARSVERHSKYIARRQARNLLDALAFADEIGLRLNVAVDICWPMFSGIVDDRTRFARCQQRLSKWAKRRGFALTLIWTRELGKYGSPHTHVLIHVPPWLMESNEFQLALERALEPEGGPNHEKAIMIQPAYRPLGKLLYNLKGVDPKHACGFGIRPAYQGELLGKRAGCTQNLSTSARHKATTREDENPSSVASAGSVSAPAIRGSSEILHSSASKFSLGDDAYSVARGRKLNGAESKPAQKDQNDRPDSQVPPAEVIAQAIKVYQNDRHGRWRVGNYLPSGRRRKQSFDISHADVSGLLRSLWPGYITDQTCIADRCFGGDINRATPRWQSRLEAALDRETQARREFGARREKWEQRQRELERLRRQRMPPEQRRELERKEHDERMRVLSAEYDERDKRYARKMLHDIKVAISKGGSESQCCHLLDYIAATGSDGATVLDIAYIAVRQYARGLRLNPPDDVERWGNDIAQALAARGLVCAIAADRFIRPEHKGAT